jgi:hypothetical protein
MGWTAHILGLRVVYPSCSTNSLRLPGGVAPIDMIVSWPPRVEVCQSGYSRRTSHDNLFLVTSVPARVVRPYFSLSARRRSPQASRAPLAVAPGTPPQGDSLPRASLRPTRATP